MVNVQKVFLHSAEMAEHANGAAQYINALGGGRYATKEQTRDMLDYIYVCWYKTQYRVPFCFTRRKGCRNTP